MGSSGRAKANGTPDSQPGTYAAMLSVRAPNRLIVTAYLARAALLWLLARAALGIVLLFGGFDPIRLLPIARMEVVLLSVAIGFLDVRRRHEFVLLGNLGVRRRVLALLFAIPAIVADVVLGLVLR